MLNLPPQKHHKYGVILGGWVFGVMFFCMLQLKLFSYSFSCFLWLDCGWTKP